MVDAIQSGATAGTIRRLDAGHEEIPAELFGHSTHAFGVADAIELARTLKELPPQLVVYGIEGQVFAAGEKLSAPIETVIPELAAQVLVECRNLAG